MCSLLRDKAVVCWCVVVEVDFEAVDLLPLSDLKLTLVNKLKVV